MELGSTKSIEEATKKSSESHTKKIRVIAFYLPQFHPVPENDEWWGEGFTEWTNVRRAQPLFEGHEQPRIPGELGYYNLLDPEVRQQQASLAQEHGVTAFCYYHYWFGGRRILEQPFNEVLKSRKPDFPFCLCWANESWTGIWHGAPNRVLIEQTYPGNEDHIRHFEALIPAFRDERYVRIDGKPIFLVFLPFKIPNAANTMALWRELADRAGLEGLYLIGVRNWATGWQPAMHGFDASTTFRLPPHPGPGVIPRRVPTNAGQIICYDHEHIVEHLVAPVETEFIDYPCISPNWDNSPRSGTRGTVLRGSNPELFRRNVCTAIGRHEGRDDDRRLVFVKAWNEWAEGNYLEPDSHFGRGYLRVLRDELSRLHVVNP